MTMKIVYSVKKILWDILKVMQKKHIRKKAFLGGFSGLSREIHGACMGKLQRKKAFLAFLRLFSGFS